MTNYFLRVIVLCLCPLATWTSIEVPALLSNVLYGPDPAQKMDVYLPAGRSAKVSKVIVLIHGGGWAGGSKEEMGLPGLYLLIKFPRHAIVNIDYRLGTPGSPGYPKQIEDITLALEHMTKNQKEYKIQSKFALIGASAGGHLAMLYGYSIDKGTQVKVICNIVGPTDLTDPNLTSDFDTVLPGLVGNNTYKTNRTLFEAISPVFHITRESPKTIAFFGGADPLVPPSQGEILEKRLISAGVEHSVHIYPNEGHLFTNVSNIFDFTSKAVKFIQKNL